jgi:hypothetical protein
VTILGDSGQRYFSTSLCDDESEMEKAFRGLVQEDKEQMLKKFRKTWDIIC